LYLVFNQHVTASQPPPSAATGLMHITNPCACADAEGGDDSMAGLTGSSTKRHEHGCDHLAAVLLSACVQVMRVVTTAWRG
jgi:hypothetical protein